VGELEAYVRLMITNTVVMVAIILAKVFFNLAPTVLAYKRNMTRVIFKNAAKRHQYRKRK